VGIAGTVADILDNLTDLLTTNLATTYGERLAVRDGPPIINRTPEIEVWIGALGEEGEDTAARHTATWVTMGAGTASQREVTVDIPCCVWAIGGETDMRVRRRTAADVIDAIDVLLAPPDPLGMAEVLCGGVELALGAVPQIQSQDGAAVPWTFTIRTTARI
jgi:hypothetical protein